MPPLDLGDLTGQEQYYLVSLLSGCYVKSAVAAVQAGPFGTSAVDYSRQAEEMRTLMDEAMIQSAAISVSFRRARHLINRGLFAHGRIVRVPGTEYN